jgi:RNA polymerase-interacting CarD/CdnL/TRCF family regulator
MNIHVGDTVIHWTYGIGQVQKIEERTLFDHNVQYYMIQVSDLVVWVPVDSQLENRLRIPTTKTGFELLASILSAPGEPLPENSYERMKKVLEMLKDGRAESVCRVIRDLRAHQHVHSLNENERSLLKRLQRILLGEWSYSLAITPAQAEMDMQHLLSAAVAGD